MLGLTWNGIDLGAGLLTPLRPGDPLLTLDPLDCTATTTMGPAPGVPRDFTGSADLTRLIWNAPTAGEPDEYELEHSSDVVTWISGATGAKGAPSSFPPHVGATTGQNRAHSYMVPSGLTSNAWRVRSVNNDGQVSSWENT